VANFRIIHSPPASGRGYGLSARPTLDNKRRYGKELSAIAPAVAQQEVTILSTLMLILPVPPPEGERLQFPENAGRTYDRESLF